VKTRPEGWEITCSCESALTGIFGGNAGFQAEFDDGPGWTQSRTSNHSFDAALLSFQDANYTILNEPGALFPPDLDIMYWAMGTDSIEVLLGLTVCTATPTNDIDDPQGVVILGPGCSGGPVNVVEISRERNVLRFSTLVFKFSISDDVFVFCETIRCIEEPCGECNGDGLGRRLRSSNASISRRLQSNIESVGVSVSKFGVPDGPNVMRLGAPVATGAPASNDVAGTSNETEPPVCCEPGIDDAGFDWMMTVLIGGGGAGVLCCLGVAVWLFFRARKKKEGAENTSNV